MSLQLHRRAFVLSLLVGIAATGYIYAATVSEIWQNVYDAANTALRINIVVS